jgi:acyl-CoA synthetase (AMP-forming)/AMP-acid ligase II
MDLALNLRNLAKDNPHKIFLVYRGAEISLSKAVEMVNTLAYYLKKIGIGRGDKIAIYLPNNIEYIVSYLATFSMGAVAVPLDIRSTEEEVLNMLTHAEVKVFITHTFKHFDLFKMKKRVPGLKEVILGSEEKTSFKTITEILTTESADFKNVEINGEDPCFLFYTSGTTGRPKAVLLNYRNLDNPSQTVDYLLGPDIFGKVTLCAMPLSHIGGFDYLLFAITHNMTLVLMDRFIPVEFLKHIEKYKVSWLHLVPTMFTAILHTKEFEKFDLSSLKGVTVFGAPSPPSLIERFGEFCPQAKLFHGWGMTETTAPNTVATQANIKSVGKAPPWFKIKIVDNNGRELPLGEIGEIVVSGWPVMVGYYKAPELTKEVIKDGWLYTGDLGCLDKEGYLYIRGRKRDMIIVGGLNVFAPEVEGVISQHPKVKEVAVIGIFDKLRGEAIKAFLVLREGEKTSNEEIRSFCRKHLAGFKVPQVIEVRDSLPKTKSGKINKELLKDK